jgi:dimethylamine/trimethylamine dehydrogenase
LLRQHGCEVGHVAADDTIAPWSQNTLGYRHIRKRMAALGIEALVSHNIALYRGTTLTVENVWDHTRRELPCAGLVLVTARVPDDALYQDLLARKTDWSAAGLQSLSCIGDADAPGLIAHAVYAGHRCARELEEPAIGDVAFKRHFHTARAAEQLHDEPS